MPDTTEGTTPTAKTDNEEVSAREQAAQKPDDTTAPEENPAEVEPQAEVKEDNDRPSGAETAPDEAEEPDDATPTGSKTPTERGEESAEQARERADAEVAVAAGESAGETAAEGSGADDSGAKEPEKITAAPEGAEAKGEKKAPAMPTDPVSLNLLDHLASGAPIQGKVFGWNQGGYHVLIDGLLAFCPRSEIDLGNPKGPKKYIEKTYPFRVIEHRPEGNRFIVSRARILEEERAEKQAAVKEHMKEGAEMEGRVTSLTGFGAFVDLGGGIEGMVHVSELSHKNVDQPKELLKKGQKVQVKVLKIEQGGDRISLSMKALEPNPWKEFAEKHPRGSEFSGKITGKTDFGVFVEVEPGMEGLVHVSALPPGASLEDEAFQEGAQVTGWVKDTEVKRKRISLSLKPVPTSDPWKDVTERYPEGDVVNGTVEEIAPFGVFINLEPGLTGLLPNSEMNLPRGTNPGRVYAPGTEVKVQVGRLEPKRKRITLVPEGSKIEGSRTDFKEYKKQVSSSGGMPTLAAAFEKLKKEEDS